MTMMIHDLEEHNHAVNKRGREGRRNAKDDLHWEQYTDHKQNKEQLL